MGTQEAEPIEAFVDLFGACHGGPDRKYKVLETTSRSPTRSTRSRPASRTSRFATSSTTSSSSPRATHAVKPVLTGRHRRREGDGRVVVGAARRRAIVRVQRTALPRQLEARGVPPARRAGRALDGEAADPREGRWRWIFPNRRTCWRRSEPRRTESRCLAEPSPRCDRSTRPADSPRAEAGERPVRALPPVVRAGGRGRDSRAERVRPRDLDTPTAPRPCGSCCSRRSTIAASPSSRTTTAARVARWPRTRGRARLPVARARTAGARRGHGRGGDAGGVGRYFVTRPLGSRLGAWASAQSARDPGPRVPRRRSTRS